MLRLRSSTTTSSIGRGCLSVVSSSPSSSSFPPRSFLHSASFLHAKPLSMGMGGGLSGQRIKHEKTTTPTTPGQGGALQPKKPVTPVTIPIPPPVTPSSGASARPAKQPKPFFTTPTVPRRLPTKATNPLTATPNTSAKVAAPIPSSPAPKPAPASVPPPQSKPASTPPPPPSSSGSSAPAASAPGKKGRSGARRLLLYGTVLGVGSGIILLVIEIQGNDVHLQDARDWNVKEFIRRGVTFGNAIVRLWRDLYCAGWILIDYEWSLRGLEGDELKLKKKQVHQRSAERLRRLMNTNGGIYIKFGQHVAQLQYLLPDEYVNTMKPMLNQAPTSSYEDVRRVFKEEFGKELEDVFDEFEMKPIASASLAQVHFATLKENGQPCAVKVQHSQLQQNCESDLATVRFIIRLIHKLDSRFDYQWLADEMARSLPLECDFIHEARNSERCRSNLQCDLRQDVDIPKIQWSYTSKRVLVMERMHGCLVNDVQSLREAGISLESVSTLLSQIFSEMIFQHGFVHADPHAGNILVQRRSKHDPTPRLILLDHGLYQPLTDEFRLAYCHLWHALIRGDGEGIKKYAQQMNAGEMYPLFSSMLTRKPSDTRTHTHTAR